MNRTICQVTRVCMKKVLLPVVVDSNVYDGMIDGGLSLFRESVVTFGREW